jgi:hypothetical protein
VFAYFLLPAQSPKVLALVSLVSRNPFPSRQFTTNSATMSAINKIVANSPSRSNPSELETSVAGALHDLETNTPDLRADLRRLQFSSAREVRFLLT